MKRLLPCILSAFACCLPTTALALQFRRYSAAVHDRLIHFPGPPIYTFQTPAINPTFSPSAALFLGIGWPAHPTDWTRQMALISPRHFVYATHYPLGPDWQIAFLGTDGAQHIYGIESQTPIINRQGQRTDLMLCTLSSEVSSATGIVPFPVLNLSSEAAYTGREMIVCGSFVRAGKSLAKGFTTRANDPGFDSTRYVYFDYKTNTRNKYDCNYQGGDSGAPSFMMVDGQAALIGTASTQDRLPKKIYRNYINFIPAYLPELDLLMETRGYHVKRFYPLATTVTTQIIATDPLLQGGPARLTVNTENTGASPANNLSLILTFSEAPTALSGAGWICEAISPLVWTCHRGGLDSSGQTSLAAEWDSLASPDSLAVTTLKSFDGAAAETLDNSFPISVE